MTENIKHFSSENKTGLIERLIAVRDLPFCQIPIMTKGATKLEHEAIRIGLQPAFRNLTNEACRIKVPQLSKAATEAFGQSSRVIILVNERNYIEPVVVISTLPQRKEDDIAGVTSIEFARRLSNIQREKYTIPIRMHHLVPQNTEKKWWDRVSRFFSKDILSPAHSIHENLLALKEMEKRLNRGALIIMTPEAIKQASGKWLGGIGILLHNYCLDKKTINSENDIVIAYAHVEGTSALDFVRLMFPKLKPFFPELRIYYSEPRLLSQIKKNIEIEAIPISKRKMPSIITHYLQTDYENWVRQLLLKD